VINLSSKQKISRLLSLSFLNGMPGMHECPMYKVQHVFSPLHCIHHVE
jgi:hypothetical protein